MVAGIVFTAVGVKQTIARVDKPLATIAAIAFGGGIALYLTGLNLFRLPRDAYGEAGAAGGGGAGVRARPARLDGARRADARDGCRPRDVPGRLRGAASRPLPPRGHGRAVRQPPLESGGLCFGRGHER